MVDHWVDSLDETMVDYWVDLKDVHLAVMKAAYSVDSLDESMVDY